MDRTPVASSNRKIAESLGPRFECNCGLHCATYVPGKGVLRPFNLSIDKKRMILCRGSKVCVTGANGFIVLHLVEQLLQPGVSVTAAVRSSDSRKLAPLLAMKDKGELRFLVMICSYLGALRKQCGMPG